MPGRALLIGGAVQGTLAGVDNDIAAMKEALVAHGLTVEPAFTLTVFVSGVLQQPPPEGEMLSQLPPLAFATDAL